MRPFAADGQPPPADNEDRVWRRQVAEAAGRAADELAEDDDPHRRDLSAHLRALEAHMTDEDQPAEADDPRGVD